MRCYDLDGKLLGESYLPVAKLSVEKKRSLPVKLGIKLGTLAIPTRLLLVTVLLSFGE